MARARGISLGTTLAVVAIVAVLAFTLTALATTELSFAARAQNGWRARALAESVVHEALYNLRVSDGAFGRPTPLPASIPLGPHTTGRTVRMTNADGTGVLTFDKGTSTPWSTHNFDPGGSTAPATSGWNGDVVPEAAVELIGTGTAGAEVRSVEAVVVFPVFQFAYQSGGPLDMVGALVGSVQDATMVQSGTFSASDLQPGDVACNSSAALTGTTVLGAARACGTIALQQSTVQGRLYPDAAPVPLPQINVSTFNMSASDLTGRLTPGATSDRVLNGPVACLGDLTVNGNLDLQQAILYVGGSLTVSGQITGTGAIFVEHDATVQGAANLATSDMLALIAQGNVQVQGKSRDASLIQGIVYAGGSLDLAHVTVLGSAVSVGAAQVHDAALVYSPQYAAVKIQGMAGFEIQNSQWSLVAPVNPGVDLIVPPPTAPSWSYPYTSVRELVSVGTKPDGTFFCETRRANTATAVASSLPAMVAWQDVKGGPAPADVYMGALPYPFTLPTNWHQEGSAMVESYPDFAGWQQTYTADFYTVGAWSGTSEVQSYGTGPLAVIGSIGALLPRRLPPGTSTSSLVVDLNRFLHPGDIAQIRLWRDLP